MFEAGCGFHVVWRAAARCRGDGVWLLFFRIFLLALAGFSFRGGGAGGWAIILTSFKIFLVFSKS